MQEYSTDYDKFVTLYERAAYLVQLKRIPEAIEILEESLEFYPHEETWSLLASCYSHLDLDEKAKMAIQNCLELDPDNVDGLNTYASLKIKEEDFQEAIDILNISLSVDPKNVETVVQLSIAHIKQNEYAIAKSLLSKAEELDPTNAQVLWLKAHLATHTLDTNLYDKQLDSLLEINPNDQDALALKVYMLVSQKKIKQAHKLALSTLSMNPSHETSKSALLHVYRNQNFLLRFFVGHGFSCYYFKWTIWNVLWGILFFKAVLVWFTILTLYNLITWIGYVSFNSILRIFPEKSLLLSKKHIAQSNYFLAALSVSIILLHFTIKSGTATLIYLSCISIFLLFAGISFLQLESKMKKKTHVVWSTIILSLILLTIPNDGFFTGAITFVGLIVLCILYVFRVIGEQD